MPLRQMVNDVANLMKTLAIDKASIIGHSMGGYIVQQFAIDHADKTNKLILIMSRAKSSIAVQIFSETWQQMTVDGIEPSIVSKNSMAPFIC